MNLWQRIKSLYVPPAPEALAAQEFEHARRALLEAQSAREYADSVCKYNEARIERLRLYLRSVK